MAIIKSYFCNSLFIHSGHFYSAPSSPLLLRGASDSMDTAVWEFHAEAHRQLQVKDLPGSDGGWLPVPFLVASSFHRQCAVSILIITELVVGSPVEQNFFYPSGGMNPNLVIDQQAY